MAKCDPVFRHRWTVIITFRLWHARKCHNFIKKLNHRLVVSADCRESPDASFLPIRRSRGHFLTQLWRKPNPGRSHYGHRKLTNFWSQMTIIFPIYFRSSRSVWEARKTRPVILYNLRGKSADDLIFWWSYGNFNPLLSYLSLGRVVGSFAGHSHFMGDNDSWGSN